MNDKTVMNYCNMTLQNFKKHGLIVYMWAFEPSTGTATHGGFVKKELFSYLYADVMKMLEDAGVDIEKLMDDTKKVWNERKQAEQSAKKDVGTWAEFFKDYDWK